MSKKKIVTLITAVSLSVVIILTGTFAWFTSQDQIENKMKMDNFDVVLTETFQKVPITPGLNIEKNVGVTNIGSATALARVKITEIFDPLVATGADNQPVEYYSTTAGAPVASELDGSPINRATPVVISKTALDAMTAANSEWEAYKGTAIDDVTILQRKSSATDPSAMVVDSYFAYVTDAIDGTDTHQVVTFKTIKDNAYVSAVPSQVALRYAWNGYVDATKPAPADYGVTDGKTSGVTFDTKALSEFITVVFPAGTVSSDIDNIDNATWFYNEDDSYFYYLKPLAAGETVSLFTGLEFLKEITNSFKGAGYELTPVMDAVQYDTSKKDQAAAKDTWKTLATDDFTKITALWNK